MGPAGKKQPVKTWETPFNQFPNTTTTVLTGQTPQWKFLGPTITLPDSLHAKLYNCTKAVL